MNFHCKDDIRKDTINIGIRCYDVIRYGSILQMKSMVRPEVRAGVRPGDVYGKKIILVITDHILFNDNHSTLNDLLMNRSEPL